MAGEFENEVLEVSLEIFFKPYLEGYRERVNTLYLDEHESSDNFEYMKPINLHVLLRNKNTHLIFAKGNEDELLFIDCSDIDEDEFNHIYSESDKLVNKFIHSVTGLDEYLTVLHFGKLGQYGGIGFSEANRHTLLNRSKRWGSSKADSHYSHYNFNKALEKKIAPSIQLTTVNTNEILERVKDSSFQYEFGESAKAYNAGLYLAAASTAGIALENILRLIIVKKMKDNALPRNSFIRDSVSKLDKENILPGRLRSRVLEKNGIRNSHSHTNEDPVRKETVESLHLIIEDLVPYTF